MGEIVKFRKPRPGEKHGDKILCKSGFHKWQVIQEKQFDVKQGRLITLYRCSRCGATRSEAR